MSAANIVFNTLVKFDYDLKSTSNIQNMDGSTSTTWIWVKKICYD